MTTLAEYRGRLKSVPKLARLATLAKRAVGIDLNVVAALDGLLATIERELFARLSVTAG